MDKFCKNCKHVVSAGASTSHGWACRHPNNGGRVDPVTGEMVVMFSTCDGMRAGPQGCGTAGNWFEPRVGVDTHA